jgi:hypothetical protein
MNAKKVTYLSGLFLVLLSKASTAGAEASTQAARGPEPSVGDAAPCRPEDDARRVGLGIEADALPYALGGAHGDVWVGFDGWRARAIAATSTAPSFFTPAGFENLRTTILELEVDRFFGPRAREFRGPWVAAGGGLSLLSVDARDRSGHGSTSAFEVSGGVGWAISLPSSFYVDPWVGFTYQFNQNSIPVGDQTWGPPKFGPVLGVKLGWNALL